MKSTSIFFTLISLVLLETSEGFVVSTLFNIFSFATIPILNEVFPDILADSDPYTIDSPFAYDLGTIDTDCGEQSVSAAGFFGDVIGLSTLQVDTFSMIPFTFGFEPGLFAYSAEFEGEATLDLTTEFTGTLTTTDASICASTSLYAGETTFSGVDAKFQFSMVFDYNFFDFSVTIKEMKFSKFNWDAKRTSTSLEGLGNFTGAASNYASTSSEDLEDTLKQTIDKDFVQDAVDEVVPYTTGEE